MAIECIERGGNSCIFKSSSKHLISTSITLPFIRFFSLKRDNNSKHYVFKDRAYVLMKFKEVQQKNQ